MSTPVIRTERLLLREWRAEDREPFAALNADPRVMEFMPALLPRAQSDALARRSEPHFATHGFGPWAVEVPGVAPFIGFVGLVVPAFEAHFTPAIEIGWRLAAEHWGQGLRDGGRARERPSRLHRRRRGRARLVHDAAERALARGHAADRHDARPADDFDHPRLAPGHRLRRHVLYRLRRNRGYAEAVRLPARALFVVLGALPAISAAPALGASTRAEVVVELTGAPVAQRMPLASCATRTGTSTCSAWARASRSPRSRASSARPSRACSAPRPACACAAG